MMSMINEHMLEYDYDFSRCKKKSEHMSIQTRLKQRESVAKPR